MGINNFWCVKSFKFGVNWNCFQYLSNMKAKIIFSYILILSIFATSISKSLIVVDFELNRDYFAKVLCIKKDIPDNCCKGICQLSKELKQQESTDHSMPSQNILKFELISISENKTSVLCFCPLSLKLNYFSRLIPVQDQSISIFRPPCC